MTKKQKLAALIFISAVPTAIGIALLRAWALAAMWNLAVAPAVGAQMGMLTAVGITYCMEMLVKEPYEPTGDLRKAGEKLFAQVAQPLALLAFTYALKWILV